MGKILSYKLLGTAFKTLSDACFKADEQQRNGDEAANGCAPQAKLEGVAAEGGIDVVDVNAGTDDPAPRLEAGDVRNFGHTVVVCGAGFGCGGHAFSDSWLS